MPSDSVASFLDLAREQHLLDPDVVDDLFRQPDVPQTGLAALCDVLHRRGVLTDFQAEHIRSGRGAELNFAGYPLVDEIGPCPGGTAYRATHPDLRTPVVVRKLRADWFAPDHNAVAYLTRARDAMPVENPHLIRLLNAGMHREEAFVALEAFDGGDLKALIDDIGPMPAPLAAEYARQAALGLAAAHAHGLVHGGVKPEHLFAGPLVQTSRPTPDGRPRFRPAANATVKLAELGLLPRTTDPTDPDLPPERTAGGEPTQAGDVSMLGSTLWFLLAHRPPHHSRPITEFRPDLPPELAALIADTTAADPAARPTAAAVAERLQTIVAAPVNVEPLSPSSASGVKLGEHPGGGDSASGVGQELFGSDAGGQEFFGVDAWEQPLTVAPPEHHPPPAYTPPAHYAPPAADYDPDPFGHDATDDDDPAPVRRRTKGEPRKMSRQTVFLWVAVGVGMNLIALAIILVLFVFKAAK